jgi:predicted ribosome quality control (RQC) complex YloA/Tae2 family protein
VTLNAAEIGEVIAELASIWCGGQVQKVHMFGTRTVSLTLRVPGQSGALTLSAEPGRAGLCLIPRRGESDPEASAFCMLLRRELKGGRLEELRQLGDDRVVEVRCSRARLVIEMLGRRGVLALCDPELKVIALSPAAGVRPGLARGATYEPPPDGGRPPQVSLLTPTRANEGACERMAVARRAESGRRDLLLKHLGARLGKARRRLAHIEKDFERAAGGAELQRRGELLQIHLGQVRKGMTSVTVPDLLSGSGAPVEIALVPSLSPAANLEGLFKRARKARRAGEVATQRRDEARHDLARLEALRERAEQVAEEGLAELAEEVGVRLGPAASGARRRGDAPRLPYRAYRDCRGCRVLVGRSAGDNDRLTTNVARPHDLWLHARGVHGSHVVLPLDKGTQVDAERLLDAATLAAHFSEARENVTVEVTYTPRRYVQKPRKAPPGQVVLLREKVLLLRVEEARLRRLLSLRLDS